MNVFSEFFIEISFKGEKVFFEICIISIFNQFNTSVRQSGISRVGGRIATAGGKHVVLPPCQRDVCDWPAGKALPLATASAEANTRKKIGCICGFSCGNYHCRTMLQIVADEFCWQMIYSKYFGQSECYIQFFYIYIKFGILDTSAMKDLHSKPFSKFIIFKTSGCLSGDRIELPAIIACLTKWYNFRLLITVYTNIIIFI